MRSNSDPEALRRCSSLQGSAKQGSVGQLARMLSSSIQSESWQLPWELDLNDIEFCRGANGHEVKLGSGGFGEVGWLPPVVATAFCSPMFCT